MNTEVINEPESKHREMAIDVKNLRMNFGKFPALDGIDLAVPTGGAMALLGENGAGKTTTLRILVNLYRASGGDGTVLGKPLAADDAEFFQRIGYVSENQELPLGWTLSRYLKYLAPLYPTWDESFCQELVADFELPLDRNLGHLSRGMLMKAALIGSLAYRPALLIMDEPFSGLDPLVREELIDGILELMDGGEWTLLLSSHDIHEVERLCDAVTVIEHGRVVISESLESLQRRFRRWMIQLENPLKTAPSNPAWLLIEQHSPVNWSLIEAQHNSEKSFAAIEEEFGRVVAHDSQTLSLREIYLSLAKEKKRRRKSRVAKDATANLQPTK